MRWPNHAVETVRPSRFFPPFCPWAECSAHRSRGKGFHRHGYYKKRTSCVRIPRFYCLTCKRTCSRQTFSTTYYLKRPELLLWTAAGLVACSAHRQIARSFHCSKTSITRMAERLGRHALLFQARALAFLPPLSEAVVHDHFEAFIGRQDHALGIGTAVGANSRFVYDLDPAPHRGSGRRPDRKLDVPMKAQVSRPYVTSIRRTLRALISHVSGATTLVLKADGRQDYHAAIREEGLGSRIEMRAYPNPVRGPKGSPRSPEAFRRDRAMAPTDSLHHMYRHSCADHKRETIAFGRRLESIVGRGFLMAVWKNFIKSRSDKRRDRSTPAMQVELTDAPWRWERILAQRLFRSREDLPESWVRLYEKRWSRGLPELQRKQAA